MGDMNFQGPVEARNQFFVAPSDGATVNYNVNGRDAPPRHRQHIPFPPNEAIVQRPDLKSQLDSLLPETAMHFQSAALWGLGGSGKTQLALQYAYRLSASRSVFWVHADNETTFTNDYRDVGRALGLQINNLSDDEMLQEVRRGIEMEQKWLLVVDNADNLEIFGVDAQVTNVTGGLSALTVREERTSGKQSRITGLSTQTSDMAPAHARKPQISDDKAKAEKILRHYIPTGPGGIILWTTRDKGIFPGLVVAKRGVEVARMAQNEAGQLLTNTGYQESSDVAENENVDELLEELQWLPLAIYQAGAFMRETLTDITDYLCMLREGRDRWKTLNTTQFDLHRRDWVTNSVLETWHISIEHLKSRSAAEYAIAYKILHIIAYLDNQTIQEEFVQAAAAYSAKDGSKAEQSSPDPLDVRKATKRLIDFSFLSPRNSRGEEGKSYEMHKLVQEGVRFRLNRMAQLEAQSTKLQTGPKKQPRPAVGRPPSSLSRSATPKSRPGAKSTVPADEQRERGERHFAHAALQVIDALFPQESKVETWKHCEKYLAHATRIGDYADICGEPLGDLLRRISQFLFDRRRWREKELVDERAVALLSNQLGPNHPDTLYSMARLATTYFGQGRYNAAEELENQVLHRRREVLGDAHEDTLLTMHNLANVYTSQGRFNEAQELLVHLVNQVLGETHPVTLTSMHSLAQTYIYQGRYKEAEEQLSHVWHIREESLGGENQETINSLASLSATYYKQGRYNEAEKIDVQVLEQRRQVLGEMHPDTIHSLTSLAATYYQQGRYKEAEKMVIQVLEQRRQVLGEMHPDTIYSLAALAATYHQQGRYKEAEKMVIQVLEQRRQVLGEMHPDTIYSLAALAATYHQQGRYKEAEKMDIQVLEQRRQVLGEMHPKTLSAKHNLAIVRNTLYGVVNAVGLMRECVAQRRDVLGLDHPDTKSSHEALANWTACMERPEKEPLTDGNAAINEDVD